MHCPTCSHENPDDLNFCGACGARLGPEHESRHSTAPSSERRQLTVVFCDLVDSTRLSGALDPEDLRAVVLAYQEAVGAVVTAYDGHVAQYLGDGVLVYFGYPAAHEDSPQRAVRAALDIVEAVEALDVPLPQGFRLQCRVGIHTGVVVVGDVGGAARRERLALGEVPNVAARIQSAAAPGCVLISGDTHAFVRARFACDAEGPQQFKGIARPIETWRVRAEARDRSRVDGADDVEAAPMIGRDDELRQILAAWDEVRGGAGRAVWLSGEPGIGKSRLVRAVIRDTASSPRRVVELATSPVRQNTPLYPVIEWLRGELGLAARPAPAEAVARFEALAAEVGAAPERAVPLLAELFDVAQTAHPALPLTPQVQRELTLGLLAGVLSRTEPERRLLVVVEDLHWADATTMDLLGRVKGAAGVMLLATARPVLPCPWSADAVVRELSLDRLGRERITQMVTQLLRGRALPPEVLALLLDRTDGVPFFVEEQVKMLLESGALREVDGAFVLVGELPAGAIASSLRGSLTARLDRLGPARVVAQQASIIGRTFDFELLRAVAYEEAPALRRELRALVAAGLVSRDDEDGSRFTFKHALVVDAAYETLTRATRRVHHRHLADALKARFADTVATAPELLAHHYTEAHEHALAADYWKQAGARSAARSAYPEAVAYFQKGLACVAKLPPSTARDRQEVDLLLTAGFPFIVTRGYAHDDVRRLYTRARELDQQLAGVLSPAERFPIAYGLWLYYLTLPEFESERVFARETARAVEADGNGALLVVRGTTVGASLWQGRLDEARAPLEETVRLWDRARHAALKDTFGQDPKMVALAYLAWLYYLQGEVALSQATAREAIDHARSLGHPYSLAYALGFVAQYHYFCGDAAAAAAHAAEGVRISTEQGFPTWLATGQMYVGWTRALAGDHEGGLADVRGAQVIWGYISVMLNQPVRLGLLADTLLVAGRRDEALAQFDEAVAFARRTGELYYLPDILRRRGALRLATGDADGGERDLRDALALADELGARMLSLRAANALAQRLLATGRGAEARALLAPHARWIPSDVDAPEFDGARALFAALEAN